MVARVERCARQEAIAKDFGSISKEHNKHCIQTMLELYELIVGARYGPYLYE